MTDWKIINTGTNCAAEMKVTRLTSVQEYLLPTSCGGGWANTIMEINTFVMVMRDRPEDCCWFYRSCLFVCNEPGLHVLFLFTVGKLLIILEVFQVSIFFFQTYVLVSRSIKLKWRGLSGISQIVGSFAIWFVFQYSVHCMTPKLS